MGILFPSRSPPILPRLDSVGRNLPRVILQFTAGIEIDDLDEEDEMAKAKVNIVEAGTEVLRRRSEGVPERLKRLGR